MSLRALEGVALQELRAALSSPPRCWLRSPITLQGGAISTLGPLGGSYLHQLSGLSTAMDPSNGSSASIKKQEDADVPDAKGAGKNEPKPPVRTLNRVPRMFLASASLPNPPN